jgi:hypothetical protein
MKKTAILILVLATAISCGSMGSPANFCIKTESCEIHGIKATSFWTAYFDGNIGIKFYLNGAEIARLYGQAHYLVPSEACPKCSPINKTQEQECE